MNRLIEPLKPLLDNSTNKEEIFLKYLPNNTILKLNNCVFYDDANYDLYLDDTLFVIQKNNGKLYKQGKIIAIMNEFVKIKTSTGCININKNDYYLFTKARKNNREFYKALLNNFK